MKRHDEALLDAINTHVAPDDMLWVVGDFCWGGRVEAIEVAGSPVLFVREVEAFEASVLDGIASVVSLDDSRSAAATLSTLLDSARDASAMYPE